MFRTTTCVLLAVFCTSEIRAGEKEFRASLREISWTVNVRKPDGKLVCRGSCTVLADDKGGIWALGCNHVIEDAVGDPTLTVSITKPIIEKNIRVGSVEYKAEVVKHSSSYDLALMRIAKSGIAKEIALGDVKPLDMDEEVFHCGTFHGEYDQRVSKGTVQGYNYQIRPGSAICDGADFVVCPGSSGGGVFNAKGELCGIVSYMHGVNCSFFVPMRKIVRWLSSDEQFCAIVGAKSRDAELLPVPRTK